MGNVTELPQLSDLHLTVTGPMIGILALLLLPIVIWREKIWGWLKKQKPRLRVLPPDMKLKHWDVWLSTWFGCGLIRPAPGTMGSLGAMPFGWAIGEYFGSIGLACAALAMLCIGTVAASRFGKKTGANDDQSIVVDEVVGMWIAGIPAEGNMEVWWVAFVLFRLFDIYKPWPASWFQKKDRGGFDTMMDDVVAGIYAFPGVTVLAAFYFPT